MVATLLSLLVYAIALWRMNEHRHRNLDDLYTYPRVEGTQLQKMREILGDDTAIILIDENHSNLISTFPLMRQTLIIVTPHFLNHLETLWPALHHEMGHRTPAQRILFFSPAWWRRFCRGSC